jgi:hypothetical protein
MTPTSPTGQESFCAPAQESTAASARGYQGEVVFMYAFDVAYEMVRKPVTQLLGQPLAELAVGASKRSPRQFLFYRPQTVRLPPIERIGPFGLMRMERIVKIFSVGALSITVRVPFRVDRLEDLVTFHDLQFPDGSHLYDEVRQLAEDVRRELKAFYIRPHEQLRDEEAYTVFCIHSPFTAIRGVADEPGAGSDAGAAGSASLGAEEWLLTNRRDIAALLTEETDPRRLSDQEAEESTGKYLTYYNRDLVVVDWDAAVVVDEPQNLDETLYLMELANVQLAELEAYDRILDDAVERSYRDIAARRWRGWQATGVQRELREIRVDLARLSDELSNITKFFGDWHLARIYQALSARFHLSDWHRTIDEKLKTMDDLYQLLRSEQNNRWMLILETSIVLLFVIDLIILGIGLKK